MNFLIRSDCCSLDEKTASTYETTVLTRTGKRGVVIMNRAERERERERRGREIGDEGRRERGVYARSGCVLVGFLRDVARR